MGGLSDAEFFDELVLERGDFNPFADRGWETLAGRFEEMIPSRAWGQRGRLLDIGCGTGRSRRVYARSSLKYSGVDLSFGALRQGWGAGGSVLQADGTGLPFCEAAFEVVAFSSVLHHIPEFGRALVEAHRVLRPGGWVFAFDPNLLHPAMALFRWPRSPLYIAEGVSPNEAPLLPRALRREFVAAGFRDVDQRCQSDIPYRAVAPRLMNAFLSLYNRVDWLWEASGLGRWFGTFVLTAGRKAD